MDKSRYSAGAVDRAKADALGWLSGNNDGYPRSWEQEARDTKQRGCELFDDPEWEAPTIAGYEALEREGLVMRVGPVMKGDSERIHFKRVEGRT